MSVTRFSSSDGGNALSPALWKDIQIGNIRDGFLEGILYDEDFLGASVDGWDVSDGAGLALTTDEGGVVQFTGTTSGGTAQLTSCAFKAGADRVIAFETRVKVNDASKAYFVGLDDSTGAAPIGFTTTSAGKIGTTVLAEATAADVGTLAANTSVKLGFRIEGLDTVRFFVNGRLVYVHEIVADISDTTLCLSLSAEDGSSKISVDWVKIAQQCART